jgi:hypothetical protein
MADEDDPFIYDENGHPTGVKPTVEQPALSEHELHDVVVVTVAANELESIALINALEDEGIPAMKRGGIVHLGSAQPVDVLVPRLLLEQARSSVEKFREASSERGVQEAYKPENIEEQWNDPKQSKQMQLMTKLAVADKETRERELFDFVATALADKMPSTAMAQCLAVAGLNKDEADALVAHVQQNRLSLVREKLESFSTNCIVVACLAAFCVVTQVIMMVSASYFYPKILVGSACALVISLGMLAHSKSKLDALGR